MKAFILSWMETVGLDDCCGCGITFQSMSTWALVFFINGTMTLFLIEIRMSQKDNEVFVLAIASPITGKQNTMSFPNRLMKPIVHWLNSDSSERPFVQDAFPSLTPGEREFLLTGIHPDEFDELFKDEEESDVTTSY